MKAYKCYGVNGYNEIISFIPREGDATPDEVELYLQPYCKETKNCDDVRAIEYKGSLYFDWMMTYKDNVLYTKTYKPGDAAGTPTGEVIAIATVK